MSKNEPLPPDALDTCPECGSNHISRVLETTWLCGDCYTATEVNPITLAPVLSWQVQFTKLASLKCRFLLAGGVKVPMKLMVQVPIGFSLPVDGLDPD